MGLQYMYKAGYDPTAFVDFFEKIETLEQKTPGSVARVFMTHPMTDDRINASEEEIQKDLKPKSEYVVSTSEFNDVKARLAMLQGRRVAESPGRAPLAPSRGLDLSDDVGAVNPICRQIDAFCRKMAKHSMAAFVDGGNVAQVKPNWFTFRKRLNTAGLDRRDALAGQRAIHRNGCAR